MNRTTIISLAAVLLSASSASAAIPTPLVTGNGYGFAVFSLSSGTLSKFYAHPYSFMRPDPMDALGEGIETANFIKSASWGAVPASTETFRAGYLRESHVIDVSNSEGRSFYFMPFGLEENALIAISSPAANCLHVEWSHPILSRKSVKVSGLDVRVLKFQGVDETLAVVPLGPGKTSTNPDGESCLSGSDGWAFLSVEDPRGLNAAVGRLTNWQAGVPASALVERELKEVEAWRVRPSVLFESENERRLWRQSEIVLRMAQNREPNDSKRHGSGMIVASLPDGAWFVPWVRDMAYATIALIRMGHRDEARLALMAYFNAQPVGKMIRETGGRPYQVSVVRYFGDGSEEPFFTMEGSRNIEYDNWGLVLWALGEYVSRFNDPAFLETPTYRGTIYQSAAKYVVAPLLGELEPYKDGLIVTADTSIWEERQHDRKHFAFSSAAALQGLERFSALARLKGDEKLVSDLSAKTAALRRGFMEAFIRKSALRGTLEDGIKNEVDGAALSAIDFGIVTDTAVIRGTLDRMPALAVVSGGYRRVHCILENPKIYEYWYERQEFLFVNYSLAEVYMRLGQPEKAAPILNRMVDKSAQDDYFVPEMYVSVVNPLFRGEIGDPTGAIPMVGYGAGVYIKTLLDRESLSRR